MGSAASGRPRARSASDLDAGRSSLRGPRQGRLPGRWHRGGPRRCASGRVERSRRTRTDRHRQGAMRTRAHGRQRPGARQAPAVRMQMARSRRACRSRSQFNVPCIGSERSRGDGSRSCGRRGASRIAARKAPRGSIAADLGPTMGAGRDSQDWSRAPLAGSSWRPGGLRRSSVSIRQRVAQAARRARTGALPGVRSQAGAEARRSRSRTPAHAGSSGGSSTRTSAQPASSSSCSSA